MAKWAVVPEFQCSAWPSIQPRASASVYGVGTEAVHLTISGSWRARVTSATSSRLKPRNETTPSEKWRFEVWEGLHRQVNLLRDPTSTLDHLTSQIRHVGSVCGQEVG
jgi:hypothetical protein